MVTLLFQCNSLSLKKSLNSDFYLTVFYKVNLGSERAYAIIYSLLESASHQP